MTAAGAVVPIEVAEELRRLRQLLAAFYQLGTSIELSAVLRNTLQAAAELMSAESASIALLNEAGTHLEFVESTDKDAGSLKTMPVPLDQGIVGHVARHHESVRIDDAQQDTRFFAAVDRRLGTITGSYLCVPLAVRGRCIGTAQVMNRSGGASFSAADQELLEGFGRQAALAIDNACMLEVSLRQKALDTELAVCARLQKHLFPVGLPSLGELELFAASRPCREVGGDYYTFVERPDGSVDLVIADVSGKGLPAAMVVSDLHSAYRLLSAGDADLAAMVGELNDHLRESLPTNTFVTLFALRVWPHDPEVEYVVAGHPPPFLVAANGGSTRLDVCGPVLGCLPLGYTSRRLLLRPGDLLVAFTDGYSEAEAPDGEELGEPEIGRLAAGAGAEPLSEIAALLDRAVGRFRDGNPSKDDETLLLLRRERST